MQVKFIKFHSAKWELHKISKFHNQEWLNALKSTLQCHILNHLHKVTISMTEFSIISRLSLEVKNYENQSKKMPI